MTAKEFIEKILKINTEDELEELLYESPMEFLINLEYWNAEMILKVSKIAGISKEEVIDTIKNGDFLLMKENYDEENENL